MKSHSLRSSICTVSSRARVATRTRPSPSTGCRRTSQSASTVRAKVRPVAMVTVRACRPASPSISIRDPSRARMVCDAVSSSSDPADVSWTGLRPRSTSGVPAHASSARMRRPNAGCVTWRISAARLKLRVRATARK